LELEGTRGRIEIVDGVMIRLTLPKVQCGPMREWTFIASGSWKRLTYWYFGRQIHFYASPTPELIAPLKFLCDNEILRLCFL